MASSDLRVSASTREKAGRHRRGQDHVFLRPTPLGTRLYVDMRLEKQQPQANNQVAALDRALLDIICKRRSLVGYDRSSVSALVVSIVTHTSSDITSPRPSRTGPTLWRRSARKEKAG